MKPVSNTFSSLPLYTFAIILLFTFSCNINEENFKELKDGTGFLNLGLNLEIEKLPAGRMSAVNTDDFRITIYDKDHNLIQEFADFIDMPPEVELPTGEYYITANSDNLVNAEFENPYYEGRSDNFSIDKEEVKSINIDCSLTNCKVSISYSPDVVEDFDSYTAKVTLMDQGDFLFYDQGETREGYFITEPLYIEVALSYTKLLGGAIDRTITATIDNPLPATHYLIKVNASLEDGKILINLVVDESVAIFDIDLSDVGDIIYRSCKEIKVANPSSPDGIYTIAPDGIPENAYDCMCDMSTDGGGWTMVFSKIIGASGLPVTGITWDQAINRIPEETENVYTGLEIWNQIIGDAPSGEILYVWAPPNSAPTQIFAANLQKFDPSDHYSIHMDNYRQLLGTSVAGIFSYHNNRPYTTIDADHDDYGANCANNYSGFAWWYGSCWTGSIWGYNEQYGSYWSASSATPGSSNGNGYGNGWMYVR